MTPERVKMIAQDLINLHVPKCRLVFGRSKRTVGRATVEFGQQQIELSWRWMPEITEVALIDLMLHEIGHLLCPVSGHGKQWAFIVAAIGGNPHTRFNQIRYEREAAHRGDL